MNKKPGCIEYKCRRCGEIQTNLHAPNVFMTVIRLIAEGDFSAPGAIVTMLSHHICDDGGYGIADCIGGTPNTDVTED